MTNKPKPLPRRLKDLVAPDTVPATINLSRAIGSLDAAFDGPTTFMEEEEMEVVDPDGTVRKFGILNIYFTTRKEYKTMLAAKQALLRKEN
jgi:hypothetical protein